MSAGLAQYIRPLGRLFWREWICSGCALITSGRLSDVMEAKAARAGFPVLASRSTPMNSGVELAEKIGMTLVVLRGAHNLYE